MADSDFEFEGSITGQSQKGSIVYLYLVSLVAAVGGFLFGFDIGVISGAIPFITEQFNLNVHQEGFVVSNLLIGCVLGAFIAGPFSDRFGRKKILIFSALLFAASAIFSALPRTVTELVMARFAGGIAVGIASVISPIYIAEISPANIRGRLVAINQFAIVIGILITYISNWLLVDIGPANWRWMFAMEAFPAGFFFCALFFVPESPRFLMKSGNPDNALAILTRVGGRKDAEIVLNEIDGSLEKEEGSMKELLKPGFRLALIVGILLAVFSQWTGMNTVVYYAPEIFIRAGFPSASSALLAQVAVGFVNVLFTIVAVIFMDKLGRRLLLLIGLVGMTVCFALTGYVFESPSINATFIVIPILMYVAFFCMSLGPVTWVMLSEIFPTKIRGRAMGIATMSLWIACAVLSQTFPWLIENFEGKSFYLYSGICVAAVLFAYTMIPETKNKTLEEIEDMWLKKERSA